jgi:preprotein translocase subunit SecA
VEGHNFDVRKIVLQYDDVLNQQRMIIYKQRREVLESENISEIVLGMMMPVVERIVEAHCPADLVPEEWDLKAIVDYANGTFLKDGQLTEEDLKGKEKEEILETIQTLVKQLYKEREKEIGEETMREFEKVVVLRAVDSKWMDHIDAMDQLRQGIHLRAYGGTDPLREYQLEGFEMFQSMIESIQEEVTKYIMKAHVESNLQRQQVAEGQAVRPGGEANQPKKPVRRQEKIGRNEPCPCGSGKKYKSCCGRQAV